MCLPNFENRIGLENVVNRYLKEKDVNMFDRSFNLKFIIKACEILAIELI